MSSTHKLPAWQIFLYSRFTDRFCACLWMTLFHDVLFNNKTWSIRLTLQSDFDTLPNRNKKRRQQDETTRLILVIAQISRRARIEYSDLVFRYNLKICFYFFLFRTQTQNIWNTNRSCYWFKSQQDWNLSRCLWNSLKWVLKCFFFNIQINSYFSRFLCICYFKNTFACDKWPIGVGKNKWLKWKSVRECGESKECNR